MFHQPAATEAVLQVEQRYADAKAKEKISTTVIDTSLDGDAAELGGQTLLCIGIVWE